MDVKQRYIKEAGFDIAEEFVENIQKFDIRTGIKIADFIQNHIPNIPESILTSTILPGVIIDDDNKPITFAVEVLKHQHYEEDIIVLSDLQIVSMDEYLDLLNLNKKYNVRLSKSKSTKKHC
tara:strand:- start:93 stop:458 length:366 start_codon:yes stop_codon:yes gene_type:complete